MSNSSNGEKAVQFSLTAVTHPEDGLVTSTLVVPAFASSMSVMSLGSFMGFLNWAQQLSPEEQATIVQVPASGADWSMALRDLLQSIFLCATFTAGVAGLNHVLTRTITPYRRANAAVTTAIDYAPTTTLAATAVFGVYGVALVAANRPPPPLSVFSVLFITQWSVGTITLQSMAGRFVGHAVAASWFGIDKLRQRQQQQS